MGNNLTLKQRIILKMYELSEDELVQLNNLIAYEFVWTNDEIYLNDLEFFNTFYPDDSREARLKCHVKHRKWIKFKSNGFLESFPEMTVSKLTQTVGDIPTYIENNFEQFKDLLKL